MRRTDSPLHSLVLVLALASPPLHAQTTVAGATAGSLRVTETGAASYTIPLGVPPGIAGMEPKLALTYNSQGGNGLLGVGWGLSGLSGIHRCGRTVVQDGVNTGVRYESGDRYCLDGQRLVAISGSYGADGTEYRTERESFTKVVSYGAAGNGPAWFKAWTKSGLTIEYGNTADSRIEAQSIATVRVWALNRMEDVKGNSLTVSYDEDNANGDFRPTAIAYGVNAALGGSPVAHTLFSYASRTDASPVFIAGRMVKVMMRMTNVKTYVGPPGAGVPIADYRIEYDNSGYQGASRVASVTQCNGAGTQCMAPTATTWQAASGASGFSGAISSGGGFGGNLYHQSQIVDFNGDGLGDLVFASGMGILVAYSNGSGFSAAVQAATDSSCFYAEVCTYQAFFTAGDVNGDGLADIVTGAGVVHLSTGGGFASAGNWGASFSGKLYHQARIADFNGDGLGDLVYAHDTGIAVAYSNGSGFSAVTQVATDSSFCFYSSEGCTYQALFTAGDVNGDSLADIVTGSGVVHLSTGGGFASAGNWGASFAGKLYHQARIADFNGDGLGDLVYAHDTGIAVAHSYGIGFSAVTQAATDSSGCFYSEGCTYQALFAAGDVNGDGLADIAVGGGSSYLATRPTLDLVTRFANGLGQTFDSAFAPLSNSSVYVLEGGAAWPVRSIRPVVPQYVVSSTGIGDGAGGTRTTNYVYREGRAHHKGGGFLGFRAFEAVDAPTGIKSIASFRQDYPYHGLPLVSERQQSSGTAIGRTTNTWTNTALTPASGSGGSYHKSELAQQVEQSYELNGSLVTTATASMTYDAYGNATAVTVGTGDGYSKLTTNTYASPDTAQWLLGRLTRSSVLSTIP